MRHRFRRSAAPFATALAGAAAVLALADAGAQPPPEPAAQSSGPAVVQALPRGADDCLAALADAEAAAPPGADLLYFVIDYCPAFAAALESSTWSAVLPIDADYLGRAAVASLIELTAEYDPLRPNPLAGERLGAIVAGLEPFVPEPEPSLWQQIMEWLQNLIGGDEGEETWFGRWLETLSIPESWIKPILYALAGLTVLTVLAIVINELRLGGAFVGRTTRALRAAVAGGPTPDIPPPTLESIRLEPRVGRKVELLLALVVDRMRGRYEGLARKSLTHRELARAAVGLDADARDNLSRVAGAAERVTYADWEPDGESLQQILDSGESLIRRIENGAGTAA